MAALISWEAKLIDRNTCKVKTSFKTTITTDNMIEQIKEN